MNSKKNKLLVIGTMAYDGIETPTNKADQVLGGAATYIGLASCLFSVDCGVVSVIGEDFDKADWNMLQEKGINLDGVERVKGGKTFYWKGRYHKNMNIRDTLDTQLNVLENFNPVVPQKYKNSEVVLLGNLHPGVQLSVINQIDNDDAFIILDTMNFWMDTALPLLKDVISRVSVISINDEEALQLSGKESLFDAAKEILKMGPTFVIIKKGEHGAMLFSKENLFILPAFPLDTVVDPTGAGDTFAGGMASYLVEKAEEINFDTLKKALLHATVLASFTIEKMGVESIKMVKQESLTKRISTFKTYIQL